MEPIAIIGTGCRLPGGSTSPSRLWELLRRPRMVASEAPTSRFDVDAFYHKDPSYPGTTNAREAYYLSDDPRPFDAPFFNISAIEAESIDPQQRQLLETVYESLENAGLRLESLQGSLTGIFCGVMNNDWSELQSNDYKGIPPYLATGAARSIIANRVSYFFDWRGPSLVIDTACSSSMLALHLAVTSLQQQECSVAIATGTNLIQGPNIFISTTKLQMLSPTGRSRMWDAQADGYARGEGVISVVLKRLSDAIADGDPIECIIRATGTNQDGRTTGLTMPSSISQLDLIEKTYARAGLDSKRFEDRCQYFEAHGTGTLAGDPQEASAIHHAFFGPPVSPSPNAQGGISDGASNGILHGEGKLLVGSVKTVVGHTEGTAGLAGVLKASLSLQHGVIAPNLLFEELNPALQPFATRLKVVTEPTPWPALPSGIPRRASVNSFGFGGSNAHAILESYEPNPKGNGHSLCPQIASTTGILPFVFSATSKKSLLNLLTSYIDYLSSNPDVDLVDLGSTLFMRRSALKLRISFSASTTAELIHKLEVEINAINSQTSTAISIKRLPSPPRILGVFTGQGAQWALMGSDLIKSSSAARDWLDAMQQSLDRLPPQYRPSLKLVDELTNPACKMTSATLSQPLCTALQIMLVNFLRQIGITFTSVVGHSSGEIAAAYASGLLSASDAIRVAYLRGLVAPLASSEDGRAGAMLAVGLSADEARKICEEFKGKIAIAAINSSSSVTLSGNAEAIQVLEGTLKEKKRFCRRLRVDIAYHSHHMYPCSAPYLQALEECGITVLPGNGAEWHSSVYPGEPPDSHSLMSQYWNDNMVNPVRFADSVSNALRSSTSPPDFIIEVGPHPALKGPVQQNLVDIFPTAETRYIAPCERGRKSTESMAAVLGQVWEGLGSDEINIVDYLRLFGHGTRPELVKSLPSYPFDHSKDYISQSRLVKSHLYQRGFPNPLLGTLEPDRVDGEWRWRHYLRRKDLKWLDGHRIQTQTVFPATGYLVMALEAATVMHAKSSIQSIRLDEVTIHQAIVMPDDESAGVETLFRIGITRCDGNCVTGNFHIHASTGDTMQVRASGQLTVILGDPEEEVLAPFHAADSDAFPFSTVDIDVFYESLSKMGYGYSGVFRGIKSLSRKKDASHAKIHTVDESSEDHCFMLHPAVLDCTLQSMLGAIGSPEDGELHTLLVPTRIKSITINPMQCNNRKASGVLSTAIVTKLDADGIAGDVGLFAEGGACIVEMEGVEISALSPPDQDRTIFLQVDFGPLDLGPGAHKEPTNFSSYALTLERIALLYVKLVHAQLTDDDRAKFDGHRSRLASWVDRTLSLTSSGEHPILQADWLRGTQHDLESLLEGASGSVMVEIATAVGRTLNSFLRGEGSILEEVRKNDVLTRFYRYDMETNMMNERLGSVVGQLAFKYPRMKILEIGAGTGSATHAILENIGHSYHSYTFTDISVGFFEEAKAAFAPHEEQFIFAPLNVEIDPVHQNFDLHSYDLIVAANCLHATRSMAETMAHVRSLLKPGGYLVMLEITNTDAIRTTFLMGGFEGWWAGEKDGRVWGPMLNVPTWDRLLRDTGFGGIDLRVGLGDPTLCLYEVLVAQAVDDQISLLREPLSAPQPNDLHVPDNLLILGGSTTKTGSIVSELKATLKDRFKRILTSSSLETLKLHDSCQMAVLCLTDVDTPCFQSFTENRLKALQTLIGATTRLLWVTAGAESDCPYYGMTKGWLRSLAYEQKDTLYQYLNIEDPAAMDAKLIATSLMRLIYTQQSNDYSLARHVHAIEHELYLKNGVMQVCRLRSEKAMNQRYVSARNWVSRTVNPDDPFSTLRAVTTEQEKCALRVDERQAVSSNIDTHVRIRVRYSTARAVPVADGFLFVVVGGLEGTETRLLALSETNADTVEVAKTWTTTVVKAVADVLVARWLVDQTPSGRGLFVYDAGPLLCDAITTLALSKNVQNVRFMHPNNLSLAVGFGSAEDGPLLTAIQKEVPHPVKIESTATIYHGTSQLPSTNFDNSIPMLDASMKLASRLIVADSPVNVVTRDEVFDWSSTSPITFSPKKTYLLAGMTGSLGQAICQWIVSRGARHVILTSRHPDIHPAWLNAMAQCGAQVSAMSMDLGDRNSVVSVFRIIQEHHHPLGGIVNGALVLKDCRFEETTIDIMQGTFAAKVEGSLLLDELSEAQKSIDFFILFGSLTGVVGNINQTAYSAATGFQSALIQSRRARGLPGSIVHPGLISGVGYATRKGPRWVEHVRRTTGSLLLSERDLDKLFAEAILAGNPSRDSNREVVIGLPTTDPAENPDVFWYSNPLTWDTIDYRMKSASAHGGSSASADSPRALLEAVTSLDNVPPTVSAALIAKVRSKFNLPDDVTVEPATQLKDLGIDSLVAVDIRTWFARELAVDIPLLQILDGASIQELTSAAVEKLPPSLGGRRSR
ncbi:hypothetical protein BDW69DRAFT_205260 [Aspergillus filifer]